MALSKDSGVHTKITGNKICSRFGFGMIPKCGSILLVGPTGSGKSNFTRHFLRYKTQHDPFDFAIAFVGTQSTKDSLSEFICPSLIHSNGIAEKEDQEHLNQFIDTLKEYEAKIREKNIKILVVLDDVTETKQGLKIKAINRMWKMGRHTNITVLLCIQQGTDLLPEYRANTHWVIILGMGNDQSCQQLANFFAKSDKNIFKSHISLILSDKKTKRFVALNSLKLTTEIHEYLYWGNVSDYDKLPPLTRASKRIKYPLCSAAVNDFHKKFYHPPNSKVIIEQGLKDLPGGLRCVMNPNHTSTTTGQQLEQFNKPIEPKYDKNHVIYTGQGRNRLTTGYILDFDQDEDLPQQQPSSSIFPVQSSRQAYQQPMFSTAAVPSVVSSSRHYRTTTNQLFETL